MKRFFGLCLLPLLLSGCASTITNLTPLQQPRNEDNQYPVEVVFNSRQQTLRWDSIKPYIIVGSEAIPMRPTPLLTNRWEGLVPMAPGKNSVTYRYKIDYKFNRIGDVPGDNSAISQPQGLSLPHKNLLALADELLPAEPPVFISLEQLSQVFVLAYSLTAESSHAGGQFYYRSVPSAGALYPCELYVATRAVTGLSDGLYHFAIGRHGLSRLREGNVAQHGLFASPPGSEEHRVFPLTFFVTAIFFRSAWKYRDRSYRYHLLDSGHLVENLALALAALGLPCAVQYDYADEAVNGYLGLDPRREVCLATLRVLGTGARDDDYQPPHVALPELFGPQARSQTVKSTRPRIDFLHS